MKTFRFKERSSLHKTVTKNCNNQILFDSTANRNHRESHVFHCMFGQRLFQFPEKLCFENPTIVHI